MGSVAQSKVERSQHDQLVADERMEGMKE